MFLFFCFCLISPRCEQTSNKILTDIYFHRMLRRANHCGIIWFCFRRTRRTQGRSEFSPQLAATVDSSALVRKSDNRIFPRQGWPQPQKRQGKVQLYCQVSTQLHQEVTVKTGWDSDIKSLGKGGVGVVSWMGQRYKLMCKLDGTTI